MPAPTTRQFNFTRRALSAVQSLPDKKLYLRDSGVRGLLLEVTPAGNKSFQLRNKLHGRAHRVALGRFDLTLPDARRLPEAAAADPLTFIASRPNLSVEMARALAGAVRASMAAGHSPSRHAAALRSDPTVGDLLAEYNKHIVAFKRPESASSARTTSAHLAPLCSIRASDLTRGDVAALHAKISKAYPTMANRCLDTLRAAFNLALKHGRIAARDNPASRITRNSETQRDRFLSVAELALLRRALAAEAQDFVDFVELLLATGARKSAVLFMQHSDVDLDRAEWRVPVEQSKSGVAYTVPLSPGAVAALARRRGAAPRVFAFSESTVDRAWRRCFAQMQRLRLLDALGLPADAPGTLADLTDEAVRRRLPPAEYHLAPAVIHDLRRTVGSHAAMAGVSLPVIGGILGHTSLRATAVYARLAQDTLREAMARAAVTLAPAATVHPLRRRA